MIDNLDIFHKNGFEFHIEESAEPTQRVFMKTQPVSKNWSFDKDGKSQVQLVSRLSYSNKRAKICIFLF